MEFKGGVIVINKPSGITSHDVVNRLRRIFGTKKVGHTGTLDPMATGVLPVLVGNAVKASEYLVCDVKQYTAKITLGLETDTEDITGKVLATYDRIPDDDEVIRAVNSFRGKYMQTPPMYSALKVNGQKLCDLAREGVVIEREAREVEVFEISAVKESERVWKIDTTVSKGTYIRTLAADIGKRLQTGAVMSALRRDRSGSFTIEDAHTIESLENLDKDALHSLVVPTEKLFEDLEEIILPPFYERLAKNGAEIYLSRAKISLDATVGTRVRMKDEDGAFYALGEVRDYPAGLAVKPIKFFSE